MARKTRGGRLARTETVSVRLDGKVLLALRLASAHERRTASSFTEWAVERAVRSVKVSTDEDGKEMDAMSVVEQIWEADEAKRLMHLATLHPNLLTHEEEVLWQLIWNNTAFSKPRPSQGRLLIDPAVFIDWDAVHAHWDVLKRVAANEASASELPSGKTIRESKATLQKGERRHG